LIIWKKIKPHGARLSLAMSASDRARRRRRFPRPPLLPPSHVGQSIIPTRGRHQRRPAPISLPPHARSSPLYSTLNCRPPLLAIADHHRPPLSPYKSMDCTTVFRWRCSNTFELESWLQHWLELLPPLSSPSMRSSPSTASVWAPPTLPPLQEEPRESVVRPCLHLRRRWPLVRAIAVVFPHRRWTSMVSPFCPTTTHGFPLVQTSSLAPPCPVSHCRPVEID
jgi:hypothetical protein